LHKEGPLLRNWVRGTAGLAVLVLLAGAAAGCGKTVTISGKVTHKGKAVTTGEVLFLSDNSALTRALIAVDGTYTAKGVPVGPDKVGVDNPPPAGPSAPGLPPGKDASDDPEVKGKIWGVGIEIQRKDGEEDRLELGHRGGRKKGKEGKG